MRNRWMALGAVAFLAAVLATVAVGQQEAPTGEPARRVVVTIDDLPANMYGGDLYDWQEMTATLLEGLVRHEVPAIGFVNESKLYRDSAEPDSAYVALLQAWIDAGLELGNHTYSHPDLHRTELAEFQADVLRGEIVTRELLATAGAEPKYFRHPMLHTGSDLETRDALHAFLAEHGYEVAPVTIDNQEYIAARAYDHALVTGDAQMAARIALAYVEYMEAMFEYYEEQSVALLGYELPQVLLIHANRLNADVIDPLLDMIRGRGYTFITLEEALQDPAYDSEDRYAGPAGITWLHRWALTAGRRGAFFGTEPDLPAFVHDVFASPPTLE